MLCFDVRDTQSSIILSQSPQKIVIIVIGNAHNDEISWTLYEVKKFIESFNQEIILDFSRFNMMSMQALGLFLELICTLKRIKRQFQIIRPVDISAQAWFDKNLQPGV